MRDCDPTESLRRMSTLVLLPWLLNLLIWRPPSKVLELMMVYGRSCDFYCFEKGGN